MARKTACHVHGAKRVDEAGMFSGGIDPTGALELIDVAEPLDPGESIRSFSVRSCWSAVEKGTVKETY